MVCCEALPNCVEGMIRFISPTSGGYASVTLDFRERFARTARELKTLT